jgi:methyl-accepting chemotaxis protein
VETKNTEECFEHQEEDAPKSGSGGVDSLGHDIVEAKDYRNVDVIATHFFIPETNWCLITKADQTDLMDFRPVLIIIFTALFIAAGFIFLLISLIISKKITKPLADLETGAEKIQAGDFNYQIKVFSNDETGLLAQAFNEMARKLSDIYKNLETKVKERTEKLEQSQIELKKALDSSERSNKLMVGRELEMIKLKKEIEEFKKTK